MYREMEDNISIWTLTIWVRQPSEVKTNDTEYTGAVKTKYRSACRQAEVQTKVLRLTFSRREPLKPN